MPRPWFGRKRIGWGLRPASWQGWALTGLYILVVLGAARTLATRHMALFVITLVVATAAYVAIAFLTSGG